MTLRNRLGLLFFSFLLLVTISVGATAWMIHDQGQDARVINLAGRQRMLVQQITAEALHLDLGGDPGRHQRTLRDAEAAFDRTLRALMAGGDAPYLPGQTVRLEAARSDDIRARLDDLHHDWTVFQTHLLILKTAAPDSPEFESAVASILTLSPQLAQQADDIVRLYETESQHGLARLRWIQFAFFLCSVGLLVFGVVIMRRAFIVPLQTLKNAAGRIGRGDLSSPVPVAGPPELRDLASSVDTMRAQLKVMTEGLEVKVGQRTRELTALYDVIREISSHLEIARVLDSVTGKARDLLESDVAFLCLLDGSGESLMLKAYNGPENSVCSTCALVKFSVAEQVLGHHQAMICDVGGCQTIAAPYRASHLAAPLRVGDRVIGALCVGSTQTATYSHEQVRLLTELANSTAIALENARLYEQAEWAATLEERQRIAADMHDGLAQTLGYIRLKTDRLADLFRQDAVEQAGNELSLISEAIDRAGREIRQSIASLRPAPQPDRALQIQLAECLAAFRESTGEISADLVIAEPSAIMLDGETATQIMRVVQEALHNARRHACATQITLCLDRQDSCYRLAVRDNGCGFELAHINGKAHFGLGIMQARASRIGGDVVIRSAPGQGTDVILTWPTGHLARQAENHRVVGAEERE